jgi:hypothetical protein
MNCHTPTCPTSTLHAVPISRSSSAAAIAMSWVVPIALAE